MRALAHGPRGAAAGLAGAGDTRLFEVMLPAGVPRAVIAKFYPVGRWTDQQILEEHGFTRELADAGIRSSAPLSIDGRTLHQRAGLRFALYPHAAARPHKFGQSGFAELGHGIARLHAVGARQPFVHRPALAVEACGEEPLRVRLRAQLADAEHETLRRTVRQALDRVRHCFDRWGACRAIRLHGNLHRGTVRWIDAERDAGPCFVDFNEACMGPAVQDLWMLLCGPREAQQAQLAHLLAGYERFFPFERRELHLIEALRTLRLVRRIAAALGWTRGRIAGQSSIAQLQAQMAAMQAPGWKA